MSAESENLESQSKLSKEVARQLQPLAVPSIKIPKEVFKSIETYSHLAKAVEEAMRPHRQLQEQMRQAVAAISQPQMSSLNGLQESIEELTRPFRELQKVISESVKLSQPPELKVAEALRQVQLDLAIPKVSVDLAELVKNVQVSSPNQLLAEELLAHSLFSEETPEVTIHTTIVELEDKTDEGHIIRAASIPWWNIYNELQNNPDFLFQFIEDGHKFEEFIAGAYEIAGWTVTLTPRSGDGGRDVIAEKSGFGALRFVEQCKAYRKDRRVTADEVRAMYGVLMADPKANKAIVTTTADFAPMIYKDPLLGPFIGNRLELKNGTATILWLKAIAEGHFR